MHFPSIVAVVALASGTLASVQDGTAIVAALQAIVPVQQSLSDAINAFDGTVALAAPIVTVSNQLSTLLSTAVNATTASVALSATDSQSVVSGLIGLVPSSNATLYALQAQKPNFDKAGLTSAIKANLVSEKALVDDLNAAISAKVISAYSSEMSTITTLIDQAFQREVDLYSS
jgi:Hydrophobic surface binding protein A